MKSKLWERKIVKLIDYCSNNGKIFRYGKEMNQHLLPSGYYYIAVRFNGKRVNCLSHRLIYQYFYGDIPINKEINHKNLIKNDNRPKNLELVTRSENIKHALKNGVKFGSLGRCQIGEKNNNSKLTEDQVLKIRFRLNSGEKQVNIAKDYGIDYRTVSSIKTYHRWAHINVIT